MRRHLYITYNGIIAKSTLTSSMQLDADVLLPGMMMAADDVSIV